MKILVTNDDGFQSDGLRSLVEKLSLLFDVTVIVPSSDKSGIGAAFTLQTDIKIKKSSSLFSKVSTFIVDGTPSDCVCIGMEYLEDDKFDLLISGINAGSNLGLDCISSGTVSAAMMGSLYNIPSIAISVCAITDVNYSVASDIAMYFAKLVRDKKVPFFKVLKMPFFPIVTSCKSLSFPTQVNTKSEFFAACSGVSAISPLYCLIHFSAFDFVLL